ncbi:hypothetical protein BURCENK562V_C4060 [Burkholderia cenocepacia K56-2Valvano]|nr:hypothetical protein BURCENK562V_C4060 [Burkholderia cenocepacia K56-2Valvano]
MHDGHDRNKARVSCHPNGRVGARSVVRCGAPTQRVRELKGGQCARRVTARSAR